MASPAQAQPHTAFGKTIPEMPREILFTSLATTVLDQISVGGNIIAEDSPGGSAVFSALGARLFSLPTASERSPVALTIHAGEDFPVEVESLLRGWNIVLDLQRLPGTSSTRAEISYHDESFESRDFRYASPILLLKPQDFRDTPMLGSKAFHLFTTPQALSEQVLALQKLREAAGLEVPLVIWEPRSRSYVPENQGHAYAAARLADIISPNHLELLELFGEPTSGPFDRLLIEGLAQRLVDSGIGSDSNGVIVVRSAEHGALILGRTVPATWIPAYWRLPPASPPNSATPMGHHTHRHSQVVDTTGAGNCFLGGYAIGLLTTGDPVAAAHFGAVASSFVVQQLGLPKLDVEAAGVAPERWNGETVLGRLEMQLASVSEDFGAQEVEGWERVQAWRARQWRSVREGLPGLFA